MTRDETNRSCRRSRRLPYRVLALRTVRRRLTACLAALALGGTAGGVLGVIPVTAESIAAASIAVFVPTFSPLAAEPVRGRTPAAPPSPPPGVVAGNDISWPQCSTARGGYANPMPDASARFVVIGLSQGQAFTTNPCLGQQVAFARGRHLLVSAYVFPTYPTNAQYEQYGETGPYDTRTAEGRLRNVGWQQAKYWVAAAARAGLKTPMIWVDVEQRKKAPRWSDRPSDRNLPVIQGLLAGLRHSGFRTGIYTTTSHWKEITGGVRLGQPEWRTVGLGGTPVQALATCDAPGNQGSPVLMAQYWTANVDYDVLCPVMTDQLIRRYFKQY